jgi:hypothetical protein
MSAERLTAAQLRLIAEQAQAVARDWRGFKVGVVPRGWLDRQLDRLVEIVNGRTP